MRLLDALQACANTARQDKEFISAAAGLPCRILLEVQSSEGREQVIAVGGESASAIYLSASPQVWQQIMLPLPPVGWHSFTAATRQTELFSVRADAIQVAQGLHALERLFEILRGQVSEEAVADEPLDLSGLTGRYATLRLGNSERLTVYHEFSGTVGMPCLLMLHTAGADSRQYHALMADAQLQQQWHMHSFDMPGHGRSPGSSRWLWQDYRLSKAAYLSVCEGVLQQVLSQPAVMLGCSMGAAMALYAARELPERVLGAIALEAPFRSSGRRTVHLTHVQVNQAAHNPSYVRGLMSPSSPLRHRRNAAWIYSQGGFQIYPGDLAFYSDEFDAAVDVQGLDGSDRPIHLLTGSYDYSATPADSRHVADLIPGAVFAEMADLGHFPMIENPTVFLRYLAPVLESVRARLN
ncbi:alpha/beta fold hydrolase [Polaromonas sp. AER18D-145]|uniref:alpha/beta fold hydrolase n=1 Tax=Polaromonas sp. AER18D-145 TaxID=1977060 RepID=UPI000BBBED1E|nr:alpha/beta hydrolase [Polaromonas sp. AER18D-145]